MKHTKGIAKVVVNDFNQITPLFVQVENHIVADVHCNAMINKQEAESNGSLIADAINTTSESGLTPSELLKQNKELLEALKEANNTLKMASLIDKSTQCEETQKLVQQAINNASK